MSPLNVFPKYRWGYRITAIGGGILMMTILLNRGVGDLVIMPILVLWILGCSSLFNNVARKKLIELNRLLDECHPEEYIKRYLSIIPVRKGKLGNVLRLNLTAGYIHYGDLESARKVMEEVDPKYFGNKLGGLTASGTYHNNWSTLFMENGQLDMAEEALGRFKAVLDNPMLRDPFKSQYYKYYNRNRAKLDLYEGNYAGAKEKWNRLLESASKLMDRVQCRYWLAHVCIHDGFPEETIQHLRFVASNGGETVYAKDARRALYNNRFDGKLLHGGELDKPADES